MGTLGPSTVVILEIMVGKIQKVISSPQLIILNQIRLYSSVMTIHSSSFTCFTVFGTLGQFGETRSQSPDFFRIFNFHYLNICVFKFSFQNGVYFGQVIQEILQNSYLKTSFENPEIRDFVPTFCNFIRRKFF